MHRTDRASAPCDSGNYARSVGRVVVVHSNYRDLNVSRLWRFSRAPACTRFLIVTSEHKRPQSVEVQSVASACPHNSACGDCERRRQHYAVSKCSCSVYRVTVHYRATTGLSRGASHDVTMMMMMCILCGRWRFARVIERRGGKKDGHCTTPN